jgi:hypothetical protein
MQKGRPIPGHMAALAVKLAKSHGIRYAAKTLELDRGTVRRYLRSAGGQSAQAAPAPAPRADQGGAT